jgi:hypothetical protein
MQAAFEACLNRENKQAIVWIENDMDAPGYSMATLGAKRWRL